MEMHNRWKQFFMSQFTEMTEDWVMPNTGRIKSQAPADWLYIVLLPRAGIY